MPSPIEIREQLEEREVILALRSLVRNPHGRILIKYLFKSFMVGETPPPQPDKVTFYRSLGLIEAGNALFKLVSRADYVSAGELLALKEKELYETPDLDEPKPVEDGPSY